jgi:hypothetical protein
MDFAVIASTSSSFFFHEYKNLIVKLESISSFSCPNGQAAVNWDKIGSC